MKNFPLAYEGNKPYIFISYAHKDTDRVLPAIEALQAAGYPVWYDAGIEVGAEWADDIAQHLLGAKMVIAFISEAAIESLNCRQEIVFATDKRKPMLTVRLDNAAMPAGMEMQLNIWQSVIAYRYPGATDYVKELVTTPFIAETLAGNKIGTAAVPTRQTTVRTTTASASSAEDETIYPMILTALEDEQALTVKQLRAANGAVDLLSPQKLAAILRRMRQLELLEKEENGKETYYSSRKAVYDKGLKQLECARTSKDFWKLHWRFKRLGDYKDAKELLEQILNKRLELKDIENEQSYNQAYKQEESAKTAEDYRRVAETFKKLGDYKESKKLAQSCANKAQLLEKDAEYESAIAKMQTCVNAEDYRRVAEAFRELGDRYDYKESKKLAQSCANKAQLLEKDAEYESAVAEMQTCVNAEGWARLASVFQSMEPHREAKRYAAECQAKVDSLTREKERLTREKERLKVLRADLDAAKKRYARLQGAKNVNKENIAATFGLAMGPSAVCALACGVDPETIADNMTLFLILACFGIVAGVVYYIKALKKLCKELKIEKFSDVDQAVCKQKEEIERLEKECQALADRLASSK